MSQHHLFSFGCSSGASISPDGLYRYHLSRTWDRGPLVNWIMLNPSTADSMRDDPTIRKCIKFSRAWGYGGLVVTNLYAYRMTDPTFLLRVPDPIGPENDRHIDECASQAEAIVVAWGANAVPARAEAVVARLTGRGYHLTCLGLTKDGMPRHPLYVAGRTLPMSFA